MRGRVMAAAAAAMLASCGGAGSDAANEATAEGSAAGNGSQGNASLPVTDRRPPTPPTAENAQQYVALVAASDLFEIETARVALEKATRAEVRELAGMIVADHQGSTADLARAAAQAQPPLRPAPVLNAAQQADIQALRAASGEAFERLWLRQQVRAHEQALTLLTSYAARGEVASLQRHASTVADPVQRHLARARELEVPAAR